MVDSYIRRHRGTSDDVFRDLTVGMAPEPRRLIFLFHPDSPFFARTANGLRRLRGAKIDIDAVVEEQTLSVERAFSYADSDDKQLLQGVEFAPDKDGQVYALYRDSEGKLVMTLTPSQDINSTAVMPMLVDENFE